MHKKSVYLIALALPLAFLAYFLYTSSDFDPIWILAWALYAQLILVWRLYSLGYPWKEIMKTFVPMMGGANRMASFRNERYRDPSKMNA